MKIRGRVIAAALALTTCVLAYGNTVHAANYYTETITQSETVSPNGSANTTNSNHSYTNGTTSNTSTSNSTSPNTAMSAAEAATASAIQVATNKRIYFNDNLAMQVLPVLNQQRAAAGLPALTWDATVTQAAKVRAIEITQDFSHTRPDGRDCLTALSDYSTYTYWNGENIACGQYSPEEVMTAWMNSPGHRANILLERYTSVGIACCFDPTSEYGYFWVQMFIEK